MEITVYVSAFERLCMCAWCVRERERESMRVCVGGGGGGGYAVIRVIRTNTYWVSSLWYNMGYYFLNRYVTSMGGVCYLLRCVRCG